MARRLPQRLQRRGVNCTNGWCGRSGWKDNTAELQEIRARHVMASFLLRQDFNLTGFEIETGEPVVWSGFHHVDWTARQCETGYWVRKSAQQKGYATEAANALLRYAFGPLGMRRVAIAHGVGNDKSRRVIEKLGYIAEGVQRGALALPGGRFVDKHVYSRLNLVGLPELPVTWGDAGRS